MNPSIAVALIALVALPPAAAAQSTAGPIAAVGCVARAVADGSLTGSPGVPPAPPNTAPTLANSAEPTGALLLNDATLPGAATGTTGSAAAEAPRSFQLDGATSELEHHVGHQVEVKGTLQTTAVGASNTQKTKVDHIRVTSVRMLADSCKPEVPR